MRVERAQVDQDDRARLAEVGHRDQPHRLAGRRAEEPRCERGLVAGKEDGGRGVEQEGVLVRTCRGRVSTGARLARAGRGWRRREQRRGRGVGRRGSGDAGALRPMSQGRSDSSGRSHLPTSPHISPHLPTSPHISPHLPTSPPYDVAKTREVQQREITSPHLSPPLSISPSRAYAAPCP